MKNFFHVKVLKHIRILPLMTFPTQLYAHILFFLFTPLEKWVFRPLAVGRPDVCPWSLVLPPLNLKPILFISQTQSLPFLYLPLQYLPCNLWFLLHLFPSVELYSSLMFHYMLRIDCLTFPYLALLKPTTEIKCICVMNLHKYRLLETLKTCGKKILWS